LINLRKNNKNKTIYEITSDVIIIYRVKYVIGSYKYINFFFSFSKIFLQFLVPIKFSITIFGSYF